MPALPTAHHFSIEPASWRDLTALRNIEKACFPLDAWPLLDLIAVLSFPNVIRIKASIAGKLVGFAAADIKPGEDLAWIATICVLPGYQRRGIATTLLETIENQLAVPRIRLCVRKGNLPAIRLYQTFGYSQIGIWPEYYQDQTDAYVFEKKQSLWDFP